MRMSGLQANPIKPDLLSDLPVGSRWINIFRDQEYENLKFLDQGCPACRYQSARKRFTCMIAHLHAGRQACVSESTATLCKSLPTCIARLVSFSKGSCFCHSIDAAWTVTWDLPHLWVLVSPWCNESRCRASPAAGALCAPMHPPRQILLARCEMHQAAVHRRSVPRLQMLMQHLAHRISGFRLKCESVYCQPCIGSWKCKGPSLATLQPSWPTTGGASWAHNTTRPRRTSTTFYLRSNRHRLSWKTRPFTSCVHVSWINARGTLFSRREDQAHQDDIWSLVGCCSWYTGNSWKTMDSSSPLPACKWSAFRVLFDTLATSDCSATCFESGPLALEWSMFSGIRSSCNQRNETPNCTPSCQDGKCFSLCTFWPPAHAMKDSIDVVYAGSNTAQIRGTNSMDPLWRLDRIKRFRSRGYVKKPKEAKTCSCIHSCLEAFCSKLSAYRTTLRVGRYVSIAQILLCAPS